MEALTDRQKRVLDTIRRESLRRGFQPSLREIAHQVGIGSASGVRGHLLALEKKGYLKRGTPGKSRALQLQGNPSHRLLPILGRIRAGAPALAEENLEGQLDLGSGFSAERGDFALRVRGDSMKDAGILEDDYVIVSPKKEVSRGQVGVVMVDGEATVKKVFVDGPRLRLEPANPAYKIQDYDLRKTEGKILGKVVGLFRKGF